MRKVHGFKVSDITYKEPGNGLPKFVKQAAAERGYGDSLESLSLYVHQNDIDNAFDCVGQGHGAKCVMAQAGRRLGAESVYFYRTTAWVDFGKGPILRFVTSKAIHKNVIEPFDRGEHDAVISGMYLLTPPRKSKSLKGRRKYEKTHRKNKHVPRKVIMHTERVSMAATTDSDTTK